LELRHLHWPASWLSSRRLQLWLNLLSSHGPIPGPIPWLMRLHLRGHRRELRWLRGMRELRGRWSFLSSRWLGHRADGRDLLSSHWPIRLARRHLRGLLRKLLLRLNRRRPRINSCRRGAWTGSLCVWRRLRRGLLLELRRGRWR